ncbi:MAG: ABC transporter substrate-binding protein [Brachymonas sp.]|nr:ABC transporter substrate-binding protein [Brachymonas sp.]
MNILLKRRFFNATLFACIAIAAGLNSLSQQVFAQTAEGVSRTSITLGQTTALTGASSALALPFHQGARLYFERVNATGGINGRTINLVSMDDAGNAVTAKANAQKLIQAGAFALFGSYGEASTMSVHEVVKETSTIVFAPQTSSDELHGANFPTLYFIRPGDSEQGIAVIRHAETLGMRKLAIVHAPDSEAVSSAEAAERSMNALGANLSSKRLLTQLDQALATSPQSLLVISDAKAAATAIKAARSKGFRGPIYGFSDTGESLLAEQLGASGAGVVLARVVPRSDNAKSVVVRELIADAQAAKLGKPNVYMLEGYISARALVEALRKAGKDLTQAKLRKAIEGISEWDMGGFRISFDGGRTGSKLVELSLIDSVGKVRE